MLNINVKINCLIFYNTWRELFIFLLYTDNTDLLLFFIVLLVTSKKNRKRSIFFWNTLRCSDHFSFKEYSAYRIPKFYTYHTLCFYPYSWDNYYFPSLMESLHPYFTWYLYPYTGTATGPGTTVGGTGTGTGGGGGRGGL